MKSAHVLLLILGVFEYDFIHTLKVINYEKREDAAAFETRIKDYVTGSTINWINIFETLQRFSRGLSVCLLSRKQIIYLCRVTLEDEAYGLQVDRRLYETTWCGKTYFIFKHIENFDTNKQHLLMAECPPIIGSEMRYYLSSTGEGKMAVNVFRQSGPHGSPISPSGYASEIDWNELEEVRRLRRERIQELRQGVNGPDRSNNPLAVPEKPELPFIKSRL